MNTYIPQQELQVIKPLNRIVSILDQEYFGATPVKQLLLLSGVAAGQGDPERKVNLYIYGPPGSGKSSLMLGVSKILPNCKVVLSASPKFMTYKTFPENCMVLLDESGNLGKYADSLMRTDADLSGVEGFSGSVKDLESVEKLRQRNLTIVRNSVDISDDQQLMDRFLCIGITPTSEYTAGVRQYVMQRRQMKPKDVESAKALLGRIASRKWNVHLPFEIGVSDRIGVRLFKLVLNLFDAYVVLNQAGLPTEPPNEHLVATEDEFEEFRQFIRESGILANIPWSKEKLAIYDVVNRATYESPMTLRQIETETVKMGFHISLSSIRRRLTELEEYVSEHPEKGSHGVKAYYLSKALPTDADIWIVRN